MRKLGFAAVCCLAAVALVSGCNKNDDKCCGSCKDKAEVKMDASGTPASGEKKCCGQCKGKAEVKMDASATPAAEGKKGCCGAKKSCADKSSM